ncbi:MAG TPA: tetratricopeptide repeat protein, partial [Xanthobacteraceae bacterium]|nr:tetratricopeptide repeat protein [Xanthobacteraceae bacterium]
VTPEKSLRYYMGSVHWLDALTPPLEQHLQKLALSVQALVRAPTPGGELDRDKDQTGREAEVAGKPGGITAATEKIIGRKQKLPMRMAALSILGIVLISAVGLLIAKYHPENISNPGPTAPAPPNSKMPVASEGLADIIAAANRGDPAAQNELGIRYALGQDGLPHDDTKAIEWYRNSARQGYAAAETNLADMYFYGRGGLDQSYADALSWYLKAADQGWTDAQFRLGYMYEKGLGTDKDVQKAVQFYRSAANQGQPEAENSLGIIYATGSDGVTEDDKQAVAWYQKAADKGDRLAEKNLGDMYYFGRGVDRDYKQALVWYTKAADQGFGDAQFRLAYMYEKGLGVDPNKATALDLYKKAAHNGSVEAQRAIDRLGGQQ